MTRRDSRRAGARSGLSKGSVPGRPCSSLKVSSRGDVDPRRVERDLEGEREGSNVVELERRFGSKAMIDTVGHELDSELFAEHGESVEERRGVWSSRARDENALARLEQSMLDDRSSHEHAEGWCVRRATPSRHDVHASSNSLQKTNRAPTTSPRPR